MAFKRLYTSVVTQESRSLPIINRALRVTTDLTSFSSLNNHCYILMMDFQELIINYYNFLFPFGFSRIRITLNLFHEAVIIWSHLDQALDECLDEES